MKRLYRVSYRQWNSCFSDMYDCEELSVGEDEEEAIAKVKEKAESDARFFKAEEITSIFGYKVILNNGEQNLDTDKINITAIANDTNKQNIFDMVIEEACRQWCCFIDEAPERKDGEGFAEFFYDIFKEKEQEYLEAYNEQQGQDWDAEMTMQQEVQNMGLREEFLDVIEREREDFLEMIDGYDTDEIIRESAYIAKFEAIHKFLCINEPLDDEQMAHLIKLNNPIGMIANRYNPQQSEVHEEFMTVIDDIAGQELYSTKAGSKSEELLKVMYEELSQKRPGDAATENLKYVFEEMRAIAPNIREEDAETLLQVDEPLKTVLDNMNGKYYVREGFDNAVKQINSVDTEQEQQGGIDLC